MPLKGSPKQKMKQAMHEAKEGRMHSGSKNGPVVTNKKQQIAIALSEAGLSKKKKKRKHGASKHSVDGRKVTSK